MKAFEESVWFRRGWTLQELLAPSMVVFLTSEWEVLGHKASTTVQDSLTSSTGSLRPFNGHEIRLPLNHWIARAARIPEDIIADYRKSSSLSIAEKRSWMDHRKTTRVEDSAYCLLGICGIYLPLIYGEREQAFERLEEAIERRNMKTNAQNSNFSTPRSSIATHTTVSDPVEIDSSDGEYSEATVNWPEVKAPVKKRETEYHVVEKPLPLSLEDTFKGTTKKLKVQRKTYDLHTGKTGVEDKILCVPIKRGLRAGSKIKYPGMGDQVEGGFQDLHFISEDKPHPLFVRNNVNDLKHTISITLKEAASGWSRTVSTIDGKQLNVANSGRTASHWTCYYPGQGMPSPNRPTIRGDLIIKVRIESR
ncbi:Protein psi1 [Pseudocercospora fuligena]|uniref:Protein psi1 n=1 Tax=Pseudocercospora fuligena TaxID=685502 RepID=A0A8H6RMR4_9PEZI|nr:Protein psi1 [Pseudocercospora fuligena]